MCPGHDSLPPSTLSLPSRRGFLFKLGLGLNALGAVLVGIPVVGYILAPARKASAQTWIKLGTVTCVQEANFADILILPRLQERVGPDAPTAPALGR